MEIILAGVSSIYGIDEIKEYFEKRGIAIKFVETEYMEQYNDDSDCDIIIAESVKTTAKSIYLPLNEYWLSYGHSMGIAQISDRAYKSSRSKKYFSELLSNNGLDYCRILSRKEAKDILDGGNKVLIKPDSYYSGHGVRVVDLDSAMDFDLYFEQAKDVTDDAKRVLSINKGIAEIWEYVSGEEYSMDVFVCNGNYSILRLCKKKIACINGIPCSVVYITVSVEQRINEILGKWIKILFGDNDISFAQFDFIIDGESERIVPIDFSCRVAGGLKEMFKLYNANIYLEALKSLISNNNTVNLSNEGIYQYNIIPLKKGVLLDDNYGMENENMIKYKKAGDYVKNIGASANARLAVIVGKDYSEQDYQRKKRKLLIGTRFIH